MIKYKYIILFFTLVLMSCSKEEESIFNIVLIETNPTEMQEFQENITVNISYEHSEGFMGFYDPDYLSLEVKDSRLTNPDFYHLIPLNPPNNQLSIQGIISLEIDSPFLLGNGNQETLYYSIRIQDREGNWSNNINAPLIYVNK